MNNTTTPEQIVTDFLHALEAKDHDKIAALLAPDLQYTNVSLPTMMGGQRVANLFELLLRKGTGFSVKIHSLAANGDKVMTERTDIIRVGTLHVAFWVCGTFQVRNVKLCCGGIILIGSIFPKVRCVASSALRP